jgi:3-hydroxyacyl-[acyl-carrier-protein] dehydratase
MLYRELARDDKIQRILELIPQKKPFRFIDRIIELDSDRAMGQYTFRHDEWFYQGHFPDQPITPGVILVECMAQIGIVAMALHLMLEEDKVPHEFTTLFQDVQIEFLQTVLPGDTVTVKVEKLFWRRNKIKAKVDLYKGDQLAASGTLAGIGVKDHHAKD